MSERLNPDAGQSSLSNPGTVKVQRDRTISIPSPDSDREMAIRWADWKMLEKRLTAASELPKDYSTLYGTLFGLSGSAGLSSIPLAIAKDLPTWILPSSITFAVGCLFCAIFTVLLSQEQRRARKTTMRDLLDDVKEIESRFTPGPTQGGQVSDVMADETSNRAGR